MKKLASHFIDLTQDACWKVYWRRDSLKKFLRLHGISEKHLATWAREETKKVYLARLFYDLINLKNDRDKIIFGMAVSLSEMEYFSDLVNCEDSKIKVEAAKVAVSQLKVEVDKIRIVKADEEAQKRRREEEEKRKEEALAAKQTIILLRDKLTTLLPLQGTARGGYEFQQWFYELSIYFDIESRPPFNSDGRQIDGAVTIDGTTFLTEAKFGIKPIGSQDIDIFLSKIACKADNTMGIFISMSSYNSGAIKTASRDKTPLLLLDSQHIYSLILPGIMTLQDVIRRVKRHASQTGEAFLPANKFSI